ncbi:iron chaperone [Flavobacterium sp. 5]|uniref:iron chaperone n=1 Tax=Flavobacterium sp. 5 TaxID=2035199 RepID=UPI001E63B5EB|nr:DUF1801 domain-containing protein [Flavobacterium sp. 5]
MKTELISVNEYIKLFPKEVQLLLEKVRDIIISNAPNTIESISYGMQAYKTNGKPLAYFAAYKKLYWFLCNSKRTY